MAGDLDLALRIHADIDAAAGNLKRLDGAVKTSSGTVSSANARQARASREAARAAQELQRAQKRAASQDTDAARAALELARTRAGSARQAVHLATAEAQTAIQAQRMARAAHQAANAHDRQAVAANRASLATRRLGAAQLGSRAAIQNVAFQVQDFAVQTAAGTSASVALAQNLPQLLGGFGALGAVIGAVVAVGLPLATMLFDMGDAADDAGKAGDQLADATDRLRSLRALAGDVEALGERYGRAAHRARELIAAQVELDRREQLRAAQGTVRDVLSDDLAVDLLAATRANVRAQAQQAALDFARDFHAQLRAVDTNTVGAFLNALPGRVPGALAEYGLDDLAAAAEAAGVSIISVIEMLRGLDGNWREAEAVVARGLARVEDGFKAIAKETGLGEEAVKKLAAAFDGLNQADGPQAQLAAIGRIRQVLKEQAQSLAEDQQEQLDLLLGDVLDVEDGLGQLVGLSGENPALDAMSDQAKGLILELSRAQAALEGLIDSAADNLAIAKIRSQTVGKPQERARRETLYRSQKNIAGQRAGLLDLGLDDGLAAQVLEPQRLAAQRASINAGQAARLGQETARAEAQFKRLAGAAGAATRAVNEHQRALKSIETAEARLGLVDAYDAAIAAANRWRDETLAAIDETAPGHDETVARINAVRDAMLAAAESAKKSTTDIGAAFAAALDELAKETGDLGALVEKAVNNAFKGMEDALVSFVTTGKADFKGLVNSILADLSRIAIRQAITGPLSQALGNALGGIASGGGGIPIPTPRPAFHGGGVASPVPFAPAMAGLAEGEVAAVLMAGEAVLTPPQARAILGERQGTPDHQRAHTILSQAARYHAGGVVSAPGIAASDIPSMALPSAAALPGGPGGPGGPAGPAGPMRVHVTVTSTGTPQRGQSAQARLDGRDLIVGVVTDDLEHGGNIYRAVRQIAAPGGGVL